jgi:hypothetical protein
VARKLGLWWDTLNTIAVDTTQMIVAADTTRLDMISPVDFEDRLTQTTQAA